MGASCTRESVHTKIYLEIEIDRELCEVTRPCFNFASLTVYGVTTASFFVLQVKYEVSDNNF